VNSLIVNALRRGCLPVLFLSLFLPAAKATITYEVSLGDQSAHLFHVTMRVPDVHGDLVLQMPAWNALYEIRDFGSRVQRVEAIAGSTALAVRKIDKLTWHIHGDGEVTVRYAIFWDSRGPFASQLNDEHAFINPAMVFLYLPERREEEIRLVFRDVPEGWQIASPEPVSLETVDRRNVYSLNARDYDEFADAPIEAGKFSLFQLKGVEPPISVAIHGDNWKQDEVEETLRKLCKYELELMGGAPYKQYLFIFHLGKAALGSGGGMEHASGTAISAGSGSQLAGVSAHEFFHLWNVKRIRPVSLEPVDYTREQYSRALWFAEGVTSTYGRYTQLRSGQWSRPEFYNDLGRQITTLESRPANRWQSAEESSLDTWFEKYDYYNGPDFSVSYYTKGQILGDLLDIEIRDRTHNAHSLDDVLRRLNDDFAKKGRLYRDSLDIRMTTEAVAGGSFQEFFDKYVSGIDPFPYAEILAKAGLLVEKKEGTDVKEGPRFVVTEDPRASESARALREAWLLGKTASARSGAAH
jgi:predicted metalloprotease with PDZ domain